MENKVVQEDEIYFIFREETNGLLKEIENGIFNQERVKKILDCEISLFRTGISKWRIPNFNKLIELINKIFEENFTYKLNTKNTMNGRLLEDFESKFIFAKASDVVSRQPKQKQSLLSPELVQIIESEKNKTPELKQELGEIKIEEGHFLYYKPLPFDIGKFKKGTYGSGYINITNGNKKIALFDVIKTINYEYIGGITDCGIPVNIVDNNLIFNSLGDKRAVLSSLGINMEQQTTQSLSTPPQEISSPESTVKKQLPQQPETSSKNSEQPLPLSNYPKKHRNFRVVHDHKTNSKVERTNRVSKDIPLFEEITREDNKVHRIHRKHRPIVSEPLAVSNEQRIETYPQQEEVEDFIIQSPVEKKLSRMGNNFTDIIASEITEQQNIKNRTKTNVTKQIQQKIDEGKEWVEIALGVTAYICNAGDPNNIKTLIESVPNTADKNNIINFSIEASKKYLNSSISSQEESKEKGGLFKKIIGKSVKTNSVTTLNSFIRTFRNEQPLFEPQRTGNVLTM